MRSGLDSKLLLVNCIEQSKIFGSEILFTKYKSYFYDETNVACLNWQNLNSLRKGPNATVPFASLETMIKLGNVQCLKGSKNISSIVFLSSRFLSPPIYLFLPFPFRTVFITVMLSAARYRRKMFMPLSTRFPRDGGGGEERRKGPGQVLF